MKHAAMKEMTTVDPESERQRLTRVYERWTRWSEQLLGRAGWEAAVEEVFGMLVIFIGLGYSIAFTPFDLGLWIPWVEPYDLGIWALESDPRIEAFFQSLPALGLSAVLGMLFVLNGWIVDQLLCRWDPSGGLPFRLRALRFMIGGLPVLGLSVLPLWASWRRKGSSSRPAAGWEPHLQQFQPHPMMARLLQRIDGITRGFMSMKKLGVLFFVNCAVVYAAGSKLAFPVDPGPKTRWLMIALSVALHLLAWLNMTYWLGALAQRFSGKHAYDRRGWIRSLLWLFPVPYMATFGALALLVREWRLNQPQALTYSIFEKGKGKPQSPSWARLETSLRETWKSASWWQRGLKRPQTLETPVAKSKVEEEVLRLCRRKSLALGFETAFLTLCFAGLVRVLDIESVFHGVFIASLAVSLFLSGLGLLWKLWCFFDFWARPGETARNPGYDGIVSVLVISQLAWAAGWIVGAEFARGDVKALGGALILIGTLGLVLQAGPIFLRLVVSVPFPTERKTRREAPWIFLFVAFLELGLTMAKGEPVGSLYAFLLLTVTCLAPLWGSLMGSLSLPWLLRPYRLNDLAGDRLSGKHRLGLLGLTVTVLMPFGGLLSPLWVYARSALVTRNPLTK